MLTTQFLLENFHFALNLFAALVFFAVGWLYLDAYFAAKPKRELIKIAGLFILSFAFLISSTYIEQTILADSLFNTNLIFYSATLFKILGYLLVGAGLIIEPIQKRPVYDKAQSNPEEKAQVFLVSGAFFALSLKAFGIIFVPITSLLVFLLLLKRATIGLEKHLRPMAIGFLFIVLSDFFGLYKLFQNTNSIFIYKIVQPFGALWILSQIALFLGTVVLAIWVFSYLLRRIQTQVFMIFNISVLIIFLVTTVSFTFLLLNNLRDNALSHLGTDVNVVKYAISSKQSETLSDAELVAQTPGIQTAIAQNESSILKTIVVSNLVSRRESFLVILASTGAVLARGEDSEKIGDSLSNDPMFELAMRGQNASSVVSTDGALAPVVSIRSAAPVKDGKNIIGVVMLGTNIDNAFVDGLKKSTGLNVSVYGGNILSATTFVAADGKTRIVGVKEDNNKIVKTVLNDNKNYSGGVSVLNVPYFAAYAPLDDLNNNPVGMLFVGQEQVSVIRAASKSIEYTFLISVLFILISVLPSYLVAKFISEQFK